MPGAGADADGNDEVPAEMAEAAGDECLLAAAFAAPVAVAGLSTGRLTTCGTVIAAATITAAAPAVMAQPGGTCAAAPAA